MIDDDNVKETVVMVYWLNGSLFFATMDDQNLHEFLWNALERGGENNNKKLWVITEAYINRISGKVVYIQPLKLQASLRAHDLTHKYKLVDVGHRFRKVSVLATMSVKFYPKKLEWTSNADWLKFNSRSAQMCLGLIGPAIVAFVRS